MQKKMLCLCISTGIVMLTGCGVEEEPYRELAKDEAQVSVAAIDQASERQYLYIRTVGKAPRYAASIRGFSQGDPKLVKLSTTKNGILVSQIDRDNIGLGHDSRYDDESNEAPVLTIGGDYIDFKCTEDRWGDCTNVEQENPDADVEWNEKKYFVPKFEDTEIAEIGYNDLSMFGDCVTKVGKPSLALTKDDNGSVTWKGYEMDLDKGVINFEIKQTYQASSSCFGDFYKGSFDNLSFTTTEFISIVALDQLVSEDYKAIPYSQKEDGTYGFFTSSHNYRDATDSDGVDGYVRTYLNRFSPEKKELTYYISNNFFEEANKPFLDAAKESVTALNIQNKLYKTGLPEIKLVQAKDKHHGDLRYNYLTLFDEPLENGLAGYGPSAANPLTGEIVSARVNQYSSNLKQGSVHYYRQIMLDYNRGKLDPTSATAYTGVDYTSEGCPGFVADAPVAPVVPDVNSTETSSIDTSMVEVIKPVDKLSAPTNKVTPIFDSKDFDARAKFDKETRDFWSEHNMMSVDTVFAAGGVDRELPPGVKGHEIDWKQPELWVNGEVGKQLIEIEKMSSELKEDLTTKLAAQAFAGTLTHEMGHNFGLRHNFAGSRDHDNTFTEAELTKQDNAFAAAGYKDMTANSEFSSQMDYNINRFATTYGAYDLAALRFAYAREVEKAPAKEGEVRDSDFVSLKTEDEKRRQELKDGNVAGSTQYGVLYNIEKTNKLRRYEYCTDGHVSLNSNCNRSDAGETLEEIGQFYIDKYNDSYETANLRDNRQDFFESNTLNYVVSRNRLFNNIRQFIEDTSIYTRLEERYGYPEGSFVELCKENGSYWFCDYQKTVNNSADFFLKLAGESDVVLEATFKYKEDDAVALQNSYNLVELLKRYDSSEMVNKLDIGEAITHLSTSPEVTDALKELIIKTQIVKAYQDKLYVEFNYKGRLLNGVKASASSPNHPYVNERDVLGVWPDKLLAVRALVSRVTPRSTTGRGNNALVDIPEVKAIFEDMLCQMVTGNTALCNKSGKLNEYLTSTADFAEQSIEPLPNYDRSVSRYLGFETVYGEPKGRSNLLQMVLRQVVLASRDSDYEGEQKARVWREYVGIHYADSSLVTKAEITMNGRKYVATEENTLALALIAQIEVFEKAKEAAAALVAADVKSGASAKPDADADEATIAAKKAADANVAKLEAINKQLTRDRLVVTYLPVLD